MNQHLESFPSTNLGQHTADGPSSANWIAVENDSIGSQESSKIHAHAVCLTQTSNGFWNSCIPWACLVNAQFSSEVQRTASRKISVVRGSIETWTWA